MADISITERLFSSDSLVEISQNRATLRENSCPDSVVEIVGIPEDVRILIVSRFPQTERFFGGDGIASRGDFSIIDEARHKLIHMEIKRIKNSSHIKTQLLGSSALVPYFRALADKQLSEKHYLEGYTESFVAIGYTSLNKRSMGDRRINGSGENIDDIKRIMYPGKLPYRSLC